jgi:hypothetical protein
VPETGPLSPPPGPLYSNALDFKLQTLSISE